MKKETLIGLLIDRELGELTPEARELLDAYLEAAPGARAEAAAMRATVDIARAATRGLPVPVTSVSRYEPPVWLFAAGPWMARAALLFLVLGVGLWAGYQVGARRPAMQVASAITRHKSHELQNQWARYQLNLDARHRGIPLQRVP